MVKKIYLICSLLFCLLSANAQIKVKFEIKSLPKSKETSPEYYLSGNFNSWKPNDTSYRFKNISGTNYQLLKNFPAGDLEFKVTRGTWLKVEAGNTGNAISNRVLKLKTDTTIDILIANWADNFKQLAPNHTASVNVHLMDSIFWIPQLKTTRRIWIYLPPSYGMSKKKYPVLYMHDGQNLFDEFTGGFGEWRIDEFLDQVSANGGKESIVVGIDNSAKERLQEYNPYDSQYGKGKGKLYLEFLVRTLKPYVDEHYRTLAEKKNTTIAGSSMGGLISMYAIAAYPKVFGNAGIFSPAFWLAKSINEELSTALPTLKQSKIYFVAGTLEGNLMIRDMKSAYQVLNADGKNKKIRIVEKVDGEHKEWFWSREFVNFYKFITH